MIKLIGRTNLKVQKMSFSTFPGFATAAIHRGQEPEQWDALQVVPPISTATTYKQETPAKPKKYDYGRAGNPTRESLEVCLAAIEGAKYGFAFSSGLSANAAVASMLKSGDNVICCDDVYGGSGRYFRNVAVNNGISTDFVDLTDKDFVEQTIKPNTKCLWMESPTNPCMKVCDIAELCALAKRKSSDILTVVDNTFMSPYFQRPLDFGADIVVHSITKYINGHSDVVMGCLVTSDEKIAKHMRFIQLVPYETREKLGITDNLIRLSVGLEEIDDLINDLDQALRSAVKC